MHFFTLAISTVLTVATAGSGQGPQPPQPATRALDAVRVLYEPAEESSLITP